MSNDSWLAAFAHELNGRGLPLVRRTELTVEIEDFLAASGEQALDHFGPAVDYAAQVWATLADHDPGCPTRPDAGAAPPPVVVAVAGVSKRFRRVPVLNQVSVEVRAGQVVALMGSNGAGKSTLLRVMAGLETPDEGTVERKGLVGYVPQAGGLDPYLTPTEHFELFGTGAGTDRTEARHRGLALARELGWEADGEPMALELSGGTRQKLAVVTALVAQPELLLLDEPYQGLDAESTRRFWELLWSWGEGGGAAVVASHADDVLRRADQVVELEVAS